MFFILSKSLLFLIDPIMWLFATFGLITVLYRGRFKKIFFLIYICLLTLSLPVTGALLLGQLEKLGHSGLQNNHYPVVIVLAGMLDLKNSQGGGDLSFGDSVERILVGAQLVKEGKADFLLISGGKGSLQEVAQGEAELLANFTHQSFGLTENQILLENDSKNTSENALFSAKILQERGWTRAIVVTSAFHSFRAQGCFQKEGLQLDYIKTDYRTSRSIDLNSFLPTSQGLSHSALALHEAIGILVYWLSGKATYE